MALLVTLYSLLCHFLPCPCLAHGTFLWHHTAQVEVFFSSSFFPSNTLHAQTAGLQYLICSPSQSPVGAIPHSGNVLAGIHTCLKDDSNVFAAFPLQTQQSLFATLHLFIYSFWRKRRMCCGAKQGANTAESTQPLQNSHVWAQEQLIMLQPTLSAAPRPWKWDRLDIFSPLKHDPGIALAFLCFIVLKICTIFTV